MRRVQRPARSRWLVLAVTLTGLLPVTTACGGTSDPYADYCAEVTTQQTPITEALAGGASTGLVTALPSFEKLRAKAPADVAGDWSTVVTRIQALKDALDAAGVDPATYDPKKPPAGLSHDQLAALDAAAAGLVTTDMSQSLEAVQQEVRDVCQTPLTL